MPWYQKEKMNLALIIAYLWLILVGMNIGEASYSIPFIREHDLVAELLLAVWLGGTLLFVIYAAAMRTWKKWLAAAGVLLFCYAFPVVAAHIKSPLPAVPTPQQEP